MTRNRFYKFTIYSLCFLLCACTNFYPVTYKVANSLKTAKEKYKEEYLASAVDWPNWRGSIKKCRAGNIPKRVRRKALLRINYFRTLCGLYPVEFKEEYNHLAQQAAFLIAANDRLSHYPDKSWKCYTEEAAKGCRSSSLNYSRAGLTSNDFISGFIRENGEENYWVGHRRGILYSRSGKLGYGSTGYTEAIYHSVISKSEFTRELPVYIAYPTAGYNEIGLVYPRWSFGIPDKHDVDFSQTKVVLKDQEDNKLYVNVLPYQDIYDPTIVWELKKNIPKQELLKKEITVTVKNVLVDGKKKTYRYTVKFFDYPEEGQ